MVARPGSMVNDSMFASYCRAMSECLNGKENIYILGFCFLALVRWDQFLLDLCIL